MSLVSRTLRLGIDIDGTVTNPASFLSHLNRAFGKRLLYPQVRQYDLVPLYEITPEAFWRWYERHSADVYRTSPPSPFARDVLHRLARQHTLIYISAREPEHYDLTVQWFEAQRIPYHKIILLGSHDKVDEARRQKVALFIEDRYENACALAEALQVPVLLFDTPYNQGPLPSLVTRIRSWREVPAYVDAHAGRLCAP
ncbi:MAG TPA: hypothetical protein VIK75_07560 [Calditerricola sp.]